MPHMQLDNATDIFDVCRFDVSGRCSVQLACYPGAGARYVRHADASTAIPDRTVTALLYLNTEWNTEVSNAQWLQMLTMM